MVRVVVTLSYPKLIFKDAVFLEIR